MANVPDTEELLDNLPDLFGTSATGSNRKLAEIFNAYYSSWQDILDYAEPQRFGKTSVGPYLEAQAGFFGVGAGAGLSDAKRRSKLALRKIEKWGGVQRDAILNLASLFVGIPPAQIQILENRAVDGHYEPAAFRIRLDVSQLTAAGIPPAEIAGVIAEMETSMNRVAGAGIRAYIDVVGGVKWDDPNAIWDGPESIWSGDGDPPVPVAPPAAPGGGGMGSGEVGDGEAGD